jgi:uncharacterized membrane protein
MKYRATILNIAGLLFLLGCIIYSINKHEILSAGEGWGLLYMIGLFLFGASSLLVDLAIQWFVRKREQQQIACTISLIFYIVLFFIGK